MTKFILFHFFVFFLLLLCGEDRRGGLAASINNSNEKKIEDTLMYSLLYSPSSSFVKALLSEQQITEFPVTIFEPKQLKFGQETDDDFWKLEQKNAKDLLKKCTLRNSLLNLHDYYSKGYFMDSTSLKESFLINYGRKKEYYTCNLFWKRLKPLNDSIECLLYRSKSYRKEGTIETIGPYITLITYNKNKNKIIDDQLIFNYETDQYDLYFWQLSGFKIYSNYKVFCKRKQLSEAYEGVTMLTYQIETSGIINKTEEKKYEFNTEAHEESDMNYDLNPPKDSERERYLDSLYSIYE